MNTIFCLECGYGIDLGAEPREGQRILCTTCGARLEVINRRPLELDWVYEEPYQDPERGWQIETDSGRSGT